jgi:threonine dehydrogenase-like Zn-dependent dehydrogenase
VVGFDPVAGRRARVAESVASLDAVADLTQGRGADLVVDCVASDSSLDAAFGIVRSGGTVSVLGIHSMQRYPLDVLMGVYRSVTLRMKTAPVQQTWADLVPLVSSGVLPTDGIFTDSFALVDAPEAYAAVAARSADCIKAVLVP